MGTCDPAGDLNVRHEVGVVDMHHRAHQHRRRQIAAPATVGDQFDLQRQQLALLIEADLIAPEEWMAFAGHLHVEAAGQLDPHRAAGPVRRQRRNRGVGIGLGLLAAEAAAHAQAAADHPMRRQAKHAGDDDLGFGRVLRGGGDLHRAFAVDLGPTGLGFQIEMILATDVQLAGQRQRCARHGCAGIASGHPYRRQMKGLRGDRLLDAEQCRQRLVSHRDLFCCGLRQGLVIGHHPGHRLAVEQYGVGRNQRFVVEDRAGVVLAGHVVCGQHRMDAGQGQRGSGIDGKNPRVRVRRLHGIHAEHAAGWALLVGIDRPAGDVADGALVTR